MISRSFVFAGRAVFTITGNGTHFTFRVTRGKKSTPQRPLFFMSVRAGGGEDRDAYIGAVGSGLTLRSTPKSQFKSDAQTFKVAQYALDVVAGRKRMPAGYDITHAGRCGRCGRELTHPDSLVSGIGPECEKRIGSTSRHEPVAHEVVASDVEREMQQIEVEGDREQTRVETAGPRTCDRCNGTGVYHWGAVVNGKPTHSGPCFRCEGKGVQTRDDERRNWGYDNHAARSV